MVSSVGVMGGIEEARMRLGFSSKVTDGHIDRREAKMQKRWSGSALGMRWPLGPHSPSGEEQNRSMFGQSVLGRQVTGATPSTWEGLVVFASEGNA